MKKFVSVFLSVVLVLTVICPLTVLADEAGDVENAEADHPDLKFWEILGYDSVDDFLQWAMQNYFSNFDTDVYFENDVYKSVLYRYH